MNTKEVIKKNASYGIGAVVGLGIVYICKHWSKEKVLIVPAESEERKLELAEERTQGVVIEAADWEKLKDKETDPENEVLVTERQELIQLQDQVTNSYRENVFAGRGDWDMEAELNTRNPVNPYVLHVDEFMADEMDFRQEQLTFYAGDDVLVDAQENPIYNWAELIGELKFGYGSNDPNVVYVRNEGIHMEWEIVREPGAYSIEVLGLEAEQEVEHELRHSGPLKFRRE